MCDLMNKEGGAELVGLVVTLQSICKNISAAVRRAGISRLFGAHGSINIQGEDQQKLDILANQIFIKQLTKSCTTCLLVSEEMDNVVEVEPEKAGNYICINEKTPKGSPPTLEDVLQPGKNLIAAGYALYGSATVMMLSTGSGVDKYILDPSTGEFLLSERNIKISSDRVQYSVNESYSGSWDPKILDFVENKKKGSKSYSTKIHRNLHCRLSSNTNQAGGIGSTGKEHVLDIKPRTIHDRCPVYLGAIKEIDQLHSFLNVDKLRERIN
ncbi:FBP [Lepeophtheirus salmonis]|uniref:fructose-bisphosphatase n=1 Tax=Lepeophtheirus salmonis TaxID=72036 RepID=A0A7R8D9E1_LEPSM|nr:FBP [Lepeophtheirus salmonis]CAF3017242.1 FBP [Lepeophtheirus salmonis]